MFRGWSTRARGPEWEKITGASVTLSASTRRGDPSGMSPASSGWSGSIPVSATASLIALLPTEVRHASTACTSARTTPPNGPVGPGESEPQLWRSAFTVGMGAAWELQPGLALQAGYRFYENPMPTGQASGALLNATQHVIAASLGYRQGAHSLALTYGLDLMATPTPAHAG